MKRERIFRMVTITSSAAGTAFLCVCKAGEVAFVIDLTDEHGEVACVCQRRYLVNHFDGRAFRVSGSLQNLLMATKGGVADESQVREVRGEDVHSRPEL